MKAQIDVDVPVLEQELRKNIRGEVRFSDGDRALYSTDSSNYRQIPIGVVIPRDRSDVIATVAACRKFGAPITCRGGGTSLAGQCCNVAVIIDFTKYMNRVLEIDVERKLARVEPGQTITFQVEVGGSQPGDGRVRAEVRSDTTPAPLSVEEAVRVVASPARPGQPLPANLPR